MNDITSRGNFVREIRATYGKPESTQGFHEKGWLGGLLLNGRLKSPWGWDAAAIRNLIGRVLAGQG